MVDGRVLEQFAHIKWVLQTALDWPGNGCRHIEAIGAPLAHCMHATLQRPLQALILRNFALNDGTDLLNAAEVVGEGRVELVPQLHEHLAQGLGASWEVFLHS